MTLNPTKFDAVSLDKGEHAKADVEDLRLWYAYWWRLINDRRLIDIAGFHMLVRYGVACIREDAEEPPEPEPADGDARTSLKRRDEYFDSTEYEEACRQSFKLRAVNPLECSWKPLAKPRIFFQEFEVDVTEISNLRSGDGGYLSIDEMGKLAIVSEPAPVLDDGSRSSRGARPKKIHYVVRALADPDSETWSVTEIAFTGAASKLTQTGVVLSHTPSLPHCPYYVVPGGDENPLETDPHLRYRPMLYPLLVDITEYNYLRTLVAALARKKVSDEDVYVDISTLKPETAAYLEEVGMIEGDGAMRRLVFRKPQPGSGEMMVSPHIEKWPGEIDAHLQLLLQQVEQSIARHQPNRFQTGDNTEQSDITATQYLDMKQASALPYSGYIANWDGFIEDFLYRGLRDYVFWWDKTSPGKKYPAVANGNESLSSGTTEAGDRTFVTAEKLGRAHVLTVLTRNETQAERTQNEMLSLQRFAQKVDTRLQLLANMGHEDPEHQLEMLEEERLEEVFRPQYEQVEARVMGSLFAAITGLNIPDLMGMQPPTPPEEEGQASQLIPGRDSGTAPTWRSPRYATQAPPPPAPRSAGPMLTPAPINQPSGGNSPMGAAA